MCRIFKKKVQNVFVSLGWKENFNGGGFDAINKQGWKNVNIFYGDLIYFDNKNFTKAGGNLVLPDRAIQTVLFATDLDKVLRAKELIVHKDIKSETELRFKRVGEPFPMGIGKKRYFGCFWE